MRHSKKAQLDGTRKPIHIYPGTNVEVLWEVIKHDLPALRSMCEDYCAKRGLTPQQLVDAYPDDLSAR
jgi:uncharacterized protein with HEPN domain